MNFTPRIGPIVVGVDGSAASQGALNWAIGTAVTRGLPLIAAYVYTCCHDRVSPAGSVVHAGDSADRDSVIRIAQRELERTVRRALPVGALTSVQPIVVSAGSPSEGLLSIGGTAELIVLGTTRSADPDRACGVTVSAVMRRALCPVAVIPGPLAAG